MALTGHGSHSRQHPLGMSRTHDNTHRARVALTTTLTGHESRDVVAEDRLAEDGAVEDAADGAVRALPHAAELKFYESARHIVFQLRKRLF